MSDQPIPEVLIGCPRCGRQSPSIKCFTVPRRVFFLLLHISWSNPTFIGCPSCTRAHIATRMLTNLLSANITWPIFASIWGVQLARTYSPGHSGVIRRQLQRSGAVDFAAIP